MAQNTLTTDQKFWAFSFAVSFIIEGHPQAEAIVDEIMDDLGITKDEIDLLMRVNSSLPQPEFWYLMETFKNLSSSDKSLVKRIFHKAFNRGGGNSDTTIREMYSKVIFESGM